MSLFSSAVAQDIQPLVAIHDSELTRFLDSSNAPASGATPIGSGTTGLQWWIRDWHYFVLPEAMKEAMRADGTAFTVVGDSNITAGILLTNGGPKYPILISLASEAIRDDEIAPLTNYVAAGGVLFIGSSAFTRNTNGTTRGDFAFGNELGLHMAAPGLTNWVLNANLTKQQDHRIISHVPSGQLSWRMPSSSEEISWGTSPSHPYLASHDLWKVVSSNATVLASGDAFPYIAVKQYGNGWFVYYAGLQPLVCHGGFAPGMYTYVILRKAIEWAFELANLPVPRLSPMPFPYDSAFMVRHDLENFTNLIANVSASAQVEFNMGARGDYYFCTGTVRDDATNPTPATIIAGLRQAVTNYGASIGPHNGGLKNPGNPSLQRGDYDYWHWGPDEVLDLTPTNYANGKAYAMASLSNSFADVEGWLSGITNGLRSWVACYFNATRDDSYDVQSQLGVKITGDQKISPFPHWTFSTRTPGLRYPFSSQPVSDWYVSNLVAQSLEPWHPPGVQSIATLHDAIDFYYALGAPINFYSHSLSTGVGDAGFLAQEYLTYGLSTNLHPRLWSTNALGIYQWSVQRSNIQTTVSFSTNGYQCITKVSVAGSTRSDSSIELLVPGSGAAYGVQVLTNQVVDSIGGSFRTSSRIIKVRVGTTITNAEVRYVLGPRAQDDVYNATNGLTLSVPAPGVLSNDARGLEPGLIAVVVAGPTNGSLVLNTNGSFTYTPALNSPGSDAFTYQASDGGTNASTATVNIAIVSPDTRFADTFSRSTDPGSLSPWIAYAGGWSVTGGVLKGTPGSLNNYAIAYQTNSSSNFSAQARIRFPTTSALGGGFGARLDPSSGTRYAAWVYPENSAGGSNVLKLIKWRTWTTFDYTGSGNGLMQVVNLASVGTNWHTLKLAFYGPRIAVYYDGKQVLSMTDTEASPAPYLSGGLSTAFAPTTMYNFYVDDVSVTPLSGVESYTTPENTPLVVPPSTGVLNNDTPVFGTNLAALLVTGPTNGSLSLSANGGFTYTPASNYAGLDTFIYQATDGQTNLGVAAVTITITPDDGTPKLPAQVNRTVNELTLLTITNTATDVDLLAQTLMYQLVSPPTGATINSNGIISWTPTESQGPGTNTITTVVSDNGSPPLSATNSFTVVVNEVNLPPVLPAQTNFTTVALTPIFVTNTATDPDIPANTLNYVLASGPTNAVISTNGVISWTPLVTQVPSTNLFTTVVTDNNPAAVNAQQLSATNTFTVVVQAIHNGPNLGAQTNRTVDELTILQVTNTAAANDIPPLQLSYQLLSPPAGATINSNGIISWTPTENQGPGTNTITTVVSDNGLPPLSATNSFTVVVNEVNLPPVLPPQTNFTTIGLTSVVVTNTATDPDIPANTLTYVLSGGPTNAVISTNGVVSWTPVPAQVPSTNLFTTVVTDNSPVAVNAQQLSATNTFTVVVVPAHNGPVIGSQTNRTVNELTTLIVTNTAVSSDTPPLQLTYQLLSPPAGMSIDTNGIIFWTPNEAQGPGTNMVTTVATDNGFPPLSATNAFTVTVNEVNSAPVLPVLPDRTIAELVASSITNTATDSDIPANSLTYSLVNPPSGANINSNGVISWTPSETQGPGSYTLTTIVTDNGSPPLSATNSFNVFVSEVNTAPSFVATPSNRTVVPGASVVITNSATDADIPANNLSYTLISPPAGGAISPSGVITWTPSAAQNHTTNLIRTVVSDDGTPPLSATNSFTIIVNGNPLLSLNSTALAVEGCLPTNNAIDPGETVTVIFSIRNNGSVSTSNLVATLLQTNGIAVSSSAQNYGVIPAGGGIVAQPFTFANSGSCGGSITAVLQLQDGAANLGTLGATFALGSVATVLTQNFDSVTAPALPAGWTTTASAPQLPWFTTNTAADTPPNAAFSTDATNIGINELVSPAFTLPPGSAQLSFRHAFAFETDTAHPTNAFDGGVLEIRIGTNAFVDITNAGGVFLTNGYNEKVDSHWGNPLTNRWCWSGTNGFITTIVALPATGGQPIQLRWRAGTDNGNGGGGWRVDSIGVTGLGCCSGSVPVLAAQTNRTIAELTLLTVTNTATDPGAPPGALVYSLLSPPTGAAIDTNGIIRWTPSEAQGPGVFTLTTVVTDNSYPPLGATNSFTVTVLEVNSAPVLPGVTNYTINELTTLAVTNTASDSDVPANILSYTLLSPPANSSIDTNGVITFSPDESQGPGLYTITTMVSDNGSPVLNATNSFTVTVDEVNSAPLLPVQTNRTIVGVTALTVTNTATDSDIPLNTLAYSLVTGPTNAAIDTNGIIIWTPILAQVPSTNVFTTVVTDNNPPAVNSQQLTATNSFIVVVDPVRNSPTLPEQTNRTLVGLDPLVVTNTASVSNVPPLLLAYSLTYAPTNATIDTNGIINWIPQPADVPSTNIFRTTVCDQGLPALSDTNSFIVVVEAAPAGAPVIQSISISTGIVTITWSSVLGHDYRLEYSDFLPDSNWTAFLPDIHAFDSTCTTTNDPGSAPQRLYRVRLLP